MPNNSNGLAAKKPNKLIAGSIQNRDALSQNLSLRSIFNSRTLELMGSGEYLGVD